MKSETHLPKRLTVTETRHHMYAKQVPLRLALLTLGCAEKDWSAAGRLIGMEAKTVARALSGGVVSETLMANTLVAFRLNADRLTRVGLEITYDQFFEDRANECAQAEVVAA